MLIIFRKTFNIKLEIDLLVNNDFSQNIYNFQHSG